MIEKLKNSFPKIHEFKNIRDWHTFIDNAETAQADGTIFSYIAGISLILIFGGLLFVLIGKIINRSRMFKDKWSLWNKIKRALRIIRRGR